MVVALVVATNGPLTTLVSWVPLGIAMGNGIGLPGSYVVVGVLYLIFAVGFTAMSGYIRNAGAFYAYVAHGLGRPLGTGAAFMAILAYVACTLICYAAVGFFLALAATQHFGLVIPWWLCALVTAAVVHYFAYRDIEFNGRVLLVLMTAEVLAIVCFDWGAAASAVHSATLTAATFAPHNVFVPGFGPSIVFVVSSYMGFETTAIYSEEVHRPETAIPKATYAAIVIITILYAGSAALLIDVYGTHQVLVHAAENPGTLWFDMSERVVGPVLTDITSVLLITSLLAALISFNNATVRYWFALGRDGILWQRLATIHPKQKSAYIAGWWQSAMIVTAILVSATLHADPMRSVAPCMGIIASVGIAAVQLLTSLAVFAFFQREGHRISTWRAIVAPGISALCLCYLIYQMVVHVELLVGFEAVWVKLLPWITAVTGVIGVSFAYYLKVARPSVYSRWGQTLREA
jgi:amino acid transporter